MTSWSVAAMFSPVNVIACPVVALTMLGGKPAIDWLNSTAWHGGGAGGAPGAGAAAGGGQVAENHVHVYLDGKEIYASVKQQNYVYGTRNAGSRTGLMTPGTRT